MTAVDQRAPRGVELNGINVIAEAERQGTPRDLFWPWFASNISVFAISYPFEASTWRDKEMVRQSYRDAAFRVFGMDAHDLERMLDRTERTGDTQLACAVYHEALERGGHLPNRTLHGAPPGRQGTLQ